MIHLKFFLFSIIFVSFDTTYDSILKCTVKIHFIIWKHFHSNDDTCVHTTPLFCCYVRLICTKNRCFIFVCFSDKTRLKNLLCLHMNSDVVVILCIICINWYIYFIRIIYLIFWTITELMQPIKKYSGPTIII